MTEEELCIYPFRHECKETCGRYNLNKAAESIRRYCDQINSLNFKLENVREIVEFCRRIEEFPTKLKNFQWDEYCEKIVGYCRDLLKGVDLHILVLNPNYSIHEARSHIKKLKKDFEVLKGNINRVLPNLEKDMYDIDRRDGIWTT